MKVWSAEVEVTGYRGDLSALVRSVRRLLLLRWGADSADTCLALTAASWGAGTVRVQWEVATPDWREVGAHASEVAAGFGGGYRATNRGVTEVVGRAARERHAAGVR